MMIKIASFDNLREANEYADLLRKAGIPCVVESESWQHGLDPAESEGDRFDLLVAPEDEQDAFLVLDSATFEYEPESSAQRNMLIGGVVGSVGLLTTFGDLSGITEPWNWIPYGMVLAGAALFFKGTREEKDSD